MRRVGALAVFFTVLLMVAPGCEDTQSTDPTGFELSFDECLTVGAWVYVNGKYQDFIAIEHPHFFELPAGSYRVYVRSNAHYESYHLCWETNVSVKEGQVTLLRLPCSEDNLCPD
ncbi:MAG: hypothetical protein JXB45_03595 [Candidatus Krumholzibacteriota bacterium]|nr:hypothetical protein [Candidatus Krumholzibacteriota bacterium]